MQLIVQKLTVPELISISGDVEQQRNDIALKAVAINAITSPEHNELARASAVAIRKYIKDVEATRVELTAPALDWQRRLKSLADEHLQPLKDELKRLEGLATAFLEAEAARVRKEEELRQAAFQKAQQEQFEAQDRAAKAEARAAALAAPVAASEADPLSNAPVVPSAKAEAAMERADAARGKVDAAAAKVQHIISAPAPAMEKAKGQSLRQVLEYEVLDIHAVYAARPELCKLEISPAAVKATCNPKFHVNGLRLWWRNASTFSSR